MNIFPRPKHRLNGPPGMRPHAPAPVQTAVEEVPQAVASGTLAALIGIFLTGLGLQGTLPSDVGRFAAIGVAISLGFTVGADLHRGGFRNLVRADVMAILAFYFLTFFEFLFPQPDFDGLIARVSAYKASIVVLVGFAGLLIGRHCFRPKRQPFGDALTREVPAAWLLFIFWFCFGLGYLHMLIAVDFNIAKVIHFMMEPRFSQPWARGRLGDWKALLVELGLLLYLLPPLAGIILARRHRYPKAQLVLIMAALAFTFFFAFSSGTRNVFASYLVTFLIGYAFAVPPGRKKELILLSAGCALFMIIATVFMLRFRTVGLNNYLAGALRGVEQAEKSLFIDYNLYAIGKLTEVFPNLLPYLGWEIPIQALIRPIPRAVWPGKPEGLSASIEDALGVEGLTIAASFAGEAYMSGGEVVVFVIGLAFGAMTGWWSFLYSPRNSELGLLIYASGFFAAVISMRSMLVFTTALLPTIAALVMCTYAARVLARQAHRLLQRLLIPQQPAGRGRPVPAIRKPQL